MIVKMNIQLDFFHLSDYDMTLSVVKFHYKVSYLG